MILLLALVAGVVLLTPLSERVRVPQPILLLVYGLGLALVPGLPELQVEAGLVLPVVLPPLLFAATQRTTIQQFRDAAGPIALLAVGLTVATATMVAVVAHAVGLPWEAAAVLGAIVSPPDPVAATAVARRLRLPERMVTILEGEGMFNDATALVLYKVAVAVAVTGEFSAVGAGTELALAVGVGVAAGLVLGWLARLALAALHEGTAETTVTLAMPFVAYLGAERLGGSGVLAVLAMGLFLRQRGHSAITARGWVLGRAVWEYADFLITSLVFVLLGYELTSVIEHTSSDVNTLLLAGAVLATAIVVRPLWVFPAAAFARAVATRRQVGIPYGWRETTVVSWAGMRGVVTVATAIALPAASAHGGDLWWRDAVVLAAFGCVLVTLVAQGLTLGPLITVLKVGTQTDERAEVLRLRGEALQAALGRLEGETGDDAALQTVIASYRSRLETQRVVSAAVEGSAAADLPDRLEHRLREAFLRASAAEREYVLAQRSAGDVSPAAADQVLLEIETRAAQAGDA